MYIIYGHFCTPYHWDTVWDIFLVMMSSIGGISPAIHDITGYGGQNHL